MNAMQVNVLQVLSTQSEGYLATADASCFKAAGLEPAARVNDALVALQDGNYVEYYTEEEETQFIMVKKDEEGNVIFNDDNDVTIIWETEPHHVDPVLDEEDNVTTEGYLVPGVPKIETVSKIVDFGWIITDAGREALTKS